MISQKNMTQIVVGKDLAPVGETSTRESMSVGQIGVFKVGSSTAIDGTTDLTAGDKFKIVFKNVDGNLIESPIIEYNNIRKKVASNYVVDTEQLTYVGYNGTTGSITAANSSEYYIHLFRKDFSTTYGEHDLYKLACAYKSDASATETEIADNLVASAAKNFEQEKARTGYMLTKAGRINSATVTASNDFVNAVKVTNGINSLAGAAKVTLTGTSGTASVTGVGGLTKTATFDTDLTTTAANFVTANAAAYLAVGVTLTSSTADLIFTPTLASSYFADPVITNATGDLAGTVFTSFEYATNTSLVVGDYVRVGASTTTATALTSQVYKVTAISGSIATLDRGILEATGTYAAGGGYIEVIPSATAIAANWGLSFQSAAPPFEPGKFRYDKITFEVSLSTAFASTLVTKSTKAYKGIGTYKEVAEAEWFLNGNRGEAFRVAKYPVSGRTLNATSGKTYDVITLDYVNTNATDLDSDVLSFGSLVIYTEDESSSTVHTDLKDVLNIS